MNAQKPIPLVGAAVHPLAATPASFACPSCEGTGFFVSGAYHPDDPRCEATWDCDECDGTGEVDYEARSPPPSTLTIEEVEERIAKFFGKPTGWELAETSALGMGK